MGAEGQGQEADRIAAAPEVESGGELVAQARDDTFGVGADTTEPLQTGSADAVLGEGFELTEAATVESGLDMKLMQQYADQIDEACNGGWTGIGTDVPTLRSVIGRLNAEEYAAVDELFTKKHTPEGTPQGEEWNIMRELEDELSEGDLTQFKRLIADKSVNEVPPEYRVSGESLLKPGSGIEVGETTRMTLPGGRTYDVYVPRNADSRSPVIVAMHGAGAGDGKGVMEPESGLSYDAEKMGAIIVYASPNPREFEVTGPNTTGAAWNVPGYTDLPEQETDDYDDRDYIDSVLDHLGEHVQTSDTVGMFGFSDGGRFAQIYADSRPDRVAGVVSFHGTWMDGDREPENATPIMIVHSDSDETLPWDGGMGDTSEIMDWFVPTNLEVSKPSMQEDIWTRVNGQDEAPSTTNENGVETRIYGGGSENEVRIHIVGGADHGLHDAENNGSRAIQWALGEPDRNHDFATEGTRFLLGHIVRPGAGRRVGPHT